MILTVFFVFSCLLVGGYFFSFGPVRSSFALFDCCVLCFVFCGTASLLDSCLLSPVWSVVTIAAILEASSGDSIRLASILI